MKKGGGGEELEGKGGGGGLGMMGCCNYVYFSLVYTTSRVLVMTPLKIGTHVNVLGKGTKVMRKGGPEFV